MMMQGSMPDVDGNVSLSLYNGAHLNEFLAAAETPNDCSSSTARRISPGPFRWTAS